MIGGIRKTLTPSGHVISNNVISKFGRVGYVGSDGVNLRGVGIHIHHNTFDTGSYTGIHWAVRIRIIRVQCVSLRVC